MSGVMRALIAGAAGAIVFAAAAYPCRWLSVWALRELLIGAEAVGLMDTARGLGGQILGRNYFRHPEWVHWVAGAAAAAVGFAPAVAGAIVVMRRVSGASRRSLCGRCGCVLSGLTGPLCGRCGEEF